MSKLRDNSKDAILYDISDNNKDIEDDSLIVSNNF